MNKVQIEHTEKVTVKSLIFQPNFHWLQSLSIQRAKTVDCIAAVVDINAVHEWSLGYSLLILACAMHIKKREGKQIKWHFNKPIHDLHLCIQIIAAILVAREVNVFSSYNTL